MARAGPGQGELTHLTQELFDARVQVGVGEVERADYTLGLLSESHCEGPRRRGMSWEWFVFADWFWVRKADVDSRRVGCAKEGVAL